MRDATNNKNYNALQTPEALVSIANFISCRYCLAVKWSGVCLWIESPVTDMAVRREITAAGFIWSGKRKAFYLRADDYGSLPVEPFTLEPGETCTAEQLAA